LVAYCREDERVQKAAEEEITHPAESTLGEAGGLRKAVKLAVIQGVIHENSSVLRLSGI